MRSPCTQVNTVVRLSFKRRISHRGILILFSQLMYFLFFIFYRNQIFVLNLNFNFIRPFFFSIESNNSKCCPALPEAWVPAYAGTHAEPLYTSKHSSTFEF